MYGYPYTFSIVLVILLNYNNIYIVIRRFCLYEEEMEPRIFLVEEVSTAGLIYEYLKHLYEDKGISGRERNEWYENLLDE